MKKLIIFLVLFFSFLNISFGLENKKIIEGMYLSDGYYLGKIKKIQGNKVFFENYIYFFKLNLLNDIIRGDYKVYNFSTGSIDSFFFNENKNFLQKNKEEKYIIFYINHYTDSLKEAVKGRIVYIKYLSFLKCNKKGEIYFDTNGYEIFPMGGSSGIGEKEVLDMLGDLKECKKLEEFFSKDKRFYFGLEKQIDIRLHYFIILLSLAFILYLIIKGFKRILGKK